MARKRWIVRVKDAAAKPVFYHCISRVVDRRFAFGREEKEKFRTMMRMMEKFSGCRIVSYCLMCNHIHLLVEVPPAPVGGISDAELLERLRAIYHEAFVAEVAMELKKARRDVADGRALGVPSGMDAVLTGRDGAGRDGEVFDGAGLDGVFGADGVDRAEEIDATALVARIHARFTYRMHDLSEFMKTLMQRFTQWFNRTHERTGNLWEDAFKSVIVEDGVAAKTIAAYIDLNPVRAGMVKDPADYRWSSYGEAIGGGPRGNGKKARAGLVRALRAHKGVGADAAYWAQDVSREYRKLLMAGAAETSDKPQADKPQTGELSMGNMLRCRVRYFTDGAVIGSRNFVNEAFAGARERFGPKRKDGARKLRGAASAGAGVLWSARDLKKAVD